MLLMVRVWRIRCFGLGCSDSPRFVGLFRFFFRAAAFRGLYPLFLAFLDNRSRSGVSRLCDSIASVRCFVFV